MLFVISCCIHVAVQDEVKEIEAELEQIHRKMGTHINNPNKFAKQHLKIINRMLRLTSLRNSTSIDEQLTLVPSLLTGYSRITLVC